LTRARKRESKPFLFEDDHETSDEAGDAIRACWPDLRDTIGHLLLSSAQRPARLGCGLQGCVYQLSRGSVLKLTTDPLEVQMAARIVRARKLGHALRMLPAIEGVWTLPCAGRARTSSDGSPRQSARWYALAREDLSGLWLGGFSALDYNALVGIVSGVGTAAGAPFMRSNYLQELQHTAGWTEDPMVARNVENAIEFVRWLGAHGRMPDLHGGNWNWRESTRELVIGDLGFAYSIEHPRARIRATRRGLSGLFL